MKFNRERFINETCGNLDGAIDCIDELISILNGYIIDDETSGLHDSGCYGKDARDIILKRIEVKSINEYIEPISRFAKKPHEPF